MWVILLRPQVLEPSTPGQHWWDLTQAAWLLQVSEFPCLHNRINNGIWLMDLLFYSTSLKAVTAIHIFSLSLIHFIDEILPREEENRLSCFPLIFFCTCELKAFAPILLGLLMMSSGRDEHTGFPLAGWADHLWRYLCSSPRCPGHHTAPGLKNINARRWNWSKQSSQLLSISL